MNEKQAQPVHNLDEYDIISDNVVQLNQSDDVRSVTTDKNGCQSQQISSRHRLSSSDKISADAETQNTFVRGPTVNCKEKIVSMLLRQ